MTHIKKTSQENSLTSFFRYCFFIAVTGAILYLMYYGCLFLALWIWWLDTMYITGMLIILAAFWHGIFLLVCIIMHLCFKIIHNNHIGKTIYTIVLLVISLYTIIMFIYNSISYYLLNTLTMILSVLFVVIIWWMFGLNLLVLKAEDFDEPLELFKRPRKQV